VADLYLDEDVHHGTPAELHRLGHSAVHGAHAHRGATDDVQLLEAVRQRRVLVTSNARDFVLLHHAWTHWTQEWMSRWAQARRGPAGPPGRGVDRPEWAPAHPGILVVPNGRGPVRLAALIDGFFRSTPPPDIGGRLYRWVDAPAPAPGHWREIPPSAA
jgi:Domain of unknown function (DUF5615)